jgi:hypothetical protein
MQHRDALGKVERHFHVVLDHHDGDVGRDRRQQLLHIAPLVDREPGKGLVEQQDSRALRERHRDLDAAPFAIGGLAERPVGEIAEPDPVERRAGARGQRLLPVEPDKRVPAQRRPAEQRQRDIAQQSLAREQGDDLIGARQAEMGAAPARDPGQLAPEQSDRATVGAQFAGDQVEQGGFAGAVAADDQAALARLDRKAHRGGDATARQTTFRDRRAPRRSCAALLARPAAGLAFARVEPAGSSAP